MNVVVRPARAEEQAVIEGLMQFYIYDWSEMEKPESEAFAFNESGQFDPYPDLSDYWEKPEHWPFLIEVDGHTAGFALLNTHSHLTGGRVERNMAEFFVARKHRRRGVALDAVHQLLRQHPGQWEIAIAERNIAAKMFWPKAIESAPGVTELQLAQGDGEHWRGPIWCFHCASN
jgi:predicted acetyltransferase